MAINTQFDALEFPRFDFPYNRIESPLSTTPRLFRGLNMMVTSGGNLAKRLCVSAIANTTVPTGYRIDRLWLYETQESPPLVYFMASVADTATGRWELWYFRPGTSTAWAAVDDLRGVNDSTLPHQLIPYQGKAYVRYTPVSDKYNTIIFDGTAGAPSVHFWGIPGPTEPAHIVGALNYLNGSLDDSTTTVTLTDSTDFPTSYPYTITIDYEVMTVSDNTANVLTVTRGAEGTVAAAHEDNTAVVWRDWTASDHRVDVARTWRYTYCYVSDTDQVSSRAPLETNPDLLPSATGPFRDQVPKITVVGDADTTHIPYINIYRTRDGGGTFYFVEQIANTGASIEYLDDSLESGSGGGTYNDPLPDEGLDQGNISPSLLSNDVPPTVAEGEVGVDTPVASTPIIEFSGRLWFAIGNRLFYSGDEEIREGIPQECFPSGTFGNFFKFQFPIQNIAATSNYLYIFTLQRTYRLEGTNLETFNPRPLYDSVGMPYGHDRAICQYDENIVFMAHDYRIMQITPQGLETLSDELYTDIVDAVNGGAEMEITYWGDLEKAYIVVQANRIGATSQCRQWVLDLKKSALTQRKFWFVPWDVKAISAFSGRIAENTAQRRMVFSLYDSTAGTNALVRLEPTNRLGYDIEPDLTTQRPLNISADTNLFTNPAGNHVNQLRGPKLTPVAHDVTLERLNFPGDVDPDMYYYADDLWTDPANISIIDDPERREQSKAYKTMVGSINKAMYRIAFRFSLVNSYSPVELLSFVASWRPDKGA